MRSRPSWEEPDAGASGSWRLSAILVGLIAFVLGRLSVGDRHCSPLGSSPPLRDVADEVKHALYSPPVGHGEVAVPSVMRDVRGEIHNLRIGGVRFNVLVSRAGTMRSGDVHAQTQYDLILKGRVRLTTRENGEDVVRIFGGTERIALPPNIPHLFEFLTDTVMAEWWEHPFEARYYKPYRLRVDQNFRELSAQRTPSRQGRRLSAQEAVDEGLPVQGATGRPLLRKPARLVAPASKAAVGGRRGGDGGE